MDGVRKKREQFAISIRKQKRQEIFKAYRAKLRIDLFDEQSNRMMEILSTPQIKEEWIHSKARDLSGIPNPSWKFTIDELSSSLLCFKERGAFNIWISTSIIKNLCLLFQQDFKHLGLASEASKLLSHIIYLEEEDEQQKTSAIAMEIFQQEILRNLILYSQDTTLQHEQTSHFMTLIVNLAIYDIGPVVKNGGFTTFVEWSMRVLKQKKINRAFLEIIYHFFDFFAGNLKQIPTNFNCAIKILSLMNEFSQLNQPTPMLNDFLVIIAKTLLPPSKDSIYLKLLQFKSLTDKIFELSIHENENIRQLAWRIISLVSSGNFDMNDFFEHYNIMNRILKAYEFEPKDNRNFDKITSNILSCVSNLMCDGDYIREMIILSPIINIAIDSTHPERSTGVRKDAYYCLCTAVSTQNFKLLGIIINELPIMEKLVEGISSMVDKDKAVVRDIIFTLFQLVKTDNKIYNTYGKGLLQILENKFYLSTALTQAINKYHDDALLSQNINSFFDLYSC